MHVPSFREWLPEIPDATTLALVIARSGATGLSLDDIRRLLPIPTETLEDLLRGLTASGQVVMARAGGRIVYRAAG
jgi:hypothetical protein